MLNILQNKKVLIAMITSLLVVTAVWYFGKLRYDDGYTAGYKAGESAAIVAFTKPKEDTPKPKDTVAVQTGVATTAHVTVRPRKETEAQAPAVQVKTEAPTVAVAVNGKKYDFKPQTEILETGVKTTAAISVKVPERRWSIGLGTDGHKPAFMLKAPVSGAVGVWVAGSTKNKIMGGVTVSF